jgi:hypothetical protein
MRVKLYDGTGAFLRGRSDKRISSFCIVGKLQTRKKVISRSQKSTTVLDSAASRNMKRKPRLLKSPSLVFCFRRLT